MQKRYSSKFCKTLQESTKNGIPAQILYCEFSKISRNTFFKEPFGRLLLLKHSFYSLSYHDLSPFQKRCHTFFLAEYFLGFICRLVTKVSSISKTLSQKPIFNLFKHLGWCFSYEKVNSSTLRYFCKKAPL